MKKIKVLHLFTNYLPISQNWAYNLLESTPEVEVHIAAYFYLKENFFHPNFAFIEDDLESLHRLYRALYRKKENNFSQKIVIKSLPYLFGSFENKLIQYTKKNKIDLIHAHFAPTAWSYKSLIKKLNLPLAISFYGYDYEKLPYIQPAYQKHYQWLFHNAQSIICEGPHGMSILQQMGCPIDKIDIIPLGVKPDQTSFFQRTKSKKELKLVQVASFTEKKGQIYSLQALKRALKNCPNLHLTLVGDDKDGNWKMKSQNYIREQKLSESVKILDFIHYSDLSSFLKQFSRRL